MEVAPETVLKFADVFLIPWLIKIELAIAIFYVGRMLAKSLVGLTPAITVAELGDNSVNLNVRPWVPSGDYWAVRSDLLENVKNAFDDAGITIPYPQRDVHLYEVKAKA